MRKPIIKFMAGTLAAAMVVTSPVTVFAGNDGFLSHIYSADSTSSDESEPDSHTKTGTNSVTLGNGERVQVTWDKEWEPNPFPTQVLWMTLKYRQKT